MLAVATQKRSKATVDDSRLSVAPKALFEAVKRDAGDRIICDPIDGRWFGRLGGVLKNLPSFGPDDVSLLVDWLNAGGVGFWNSKPTFSHLITHLDKWTASARDWDRQGRRAINGGKYAAPEPVDLGAFKARKLQ
jgi:hypothetical protein